jgi:ankyrin repeat protein
MFSMNIDPQYIQYDGKTQLHFASKASNIALVTEFINLGIDINKQDMDGATALHIAKNIEIVKILLEAKCNPNLKFNHSGYTPLMDTMVWWNEAKYNLLVQVTDLNIKSKFGYTALMFSALYHSLKDINLLIDSGADKYIRNYEGMDFYDFLFDSEQEYILSRFPEFHSVRELRIDPASIKALERRIH